MFVIGIIETTNRLNGKDKEKVVKAALEGKGRGKIAKGLALTERQVRVVLSDTEGVDSLRPPSIGTVFPLPWMLRPTADN